MGVTRDGGRGAPLVLIVDDEADIADMLESYFRLEGYRTLVARDAAGAVERAAVAGELRPRAGAEDLEREGLGHVVVAALVGAGAAAYAAVRRREAAR